MTFVRKFNGKTERDDRNDRIVCAYTCPEHGELDVEVLRTESGEAPDSIPCPATSAFVPDDFEPCEHIATWTPSPIAARVRRVEVMRGKWEKPERKTYLDTRELGEGQDPEEFQAKRRKIWRDHRMDQARKEFLNK